ncbi:hypothetical protein FWKOB_09650 [Arcobacter sp. FWKO B]|nr:hypothetical protein FWKOB_09650 [Arcobacter sp. FWKO B]
MFCKNRIKPTLLRDQKTEALLVFIRTTLEQFFAQMELKGPLFDIGKKEDSEYIYSSLKKLLENLQECVINSSYLRSLIANAQKNKSLMMVAKKEEPLMVYYDTIVRAIETKLTNGTPWIPELMVIALLSEWILEEEKSTILYPFLADLNYIELIDKYDMVKYNIDDDKKEVIMNMYKTSSYLIEKLKNAKYKVNIKRSKKKN